MTGSGVARDRFRSADAGEIEQFLRERFSDDVVVDGVEGVDIGYGYEAVAGTGFAVGHTWTTLATTWDVGPVLDSFLVQRLRDGGIVRAGPMFGEAGAGVGDTVVVPPAGGFRDVADAHELDFVALDRAQVARFAEHAYGIAENDLRVTGLAPVSRSRLRRWNAAVDHVRDSVLGNPVLGDSAIALDRAFRRLATSFLSSFPNTAVFAGVRGVRRRVPESALREVREFLRTHAGDPVGPTEISAVGGAPAADVAETMCRIHDVHPAQVLWDARLLGARRTLRDADPTTADVATIAARWGFVRLGAFHLVYARAFGELPEETLRR